MSRRLPATFADYLVVAISPALIMLLVGSLMFFLIEVFYQGQYEGRLLFVMAMFVMAIVCVARISMEEGTGYAALFGLPLAIVVGIALIRFVNFSGPLAPVSALVNWGLMALVWWAAHKLTWDCTLIDDTQDASGEGLLQQIGLDEDGVTSHPASPGREPPEAGMGSAVAWWQKWLEADRRPHPPGVWVVYFSLAALPLYGIGGWFVPGDDLETRRRCFWLLVVYVASGMTLLLTTSFLGLRKYLRQRRLEMPVEMAATWVGIGLAMILAMLIVASLIPRPSPEYSVAHLVDIESIERQASRIAFGPNGGTSSPQNPSTSAAPAQKGQQGQQPGTKPSPDNQASNASEQGNSQQGESQQGGQSQSGNNGQTRGKSGSDSSSSQTQQSSTGDKASGSQSGSKSSDSGKGQSSQSSQSTQQPERGNQANDAASQPNSGQQPNQAADQGAQPPESAQSTPSSTSQASSGAIQQIVQSLGGLLRILFYLALAIAAAILAWRYRAELVAAWHKLLAELRDLFAKWFGGQTAGAAVNTPPAPPPPPGFAQFANPFASGMAGRWSLAQLVRYSFAAVEAFGREHGCPRANGQTPLEYAAAMGSIDVALGRDVRQLAELYSQLAFAPRAGTPATLDPLRSLWQRMQADGLQIRPTADT